jgi:hypothetical protein
VFGAKSPDSSSFKPGFGSTTYRLSKPAQTATANPATTHETQKKTLSSKPNTKSAASLKPVTYASKPESSSVHQHTTTPVVVKKGATTNNTTTISQRDSKENVKGNVKENRNSKDDK